MTTKKFLFAALAGLLAVAPASAQTSLNSYPDAVPLLTDKAFGVDDPAGTWSAKLFPFADVRTLIQANLTQATIAGGTITADAPLIDGSQTWNNAAVAFTADKINVTDTASLSTSLVFDRQVGGSSVINANKAGELQIGSGSVTAPAIRASDANSGLYFLNSDLDVLYAYNGSAKFKMGGVTSQITLHSTFSLGWSAGNASQVQDLSLFREASRTLAMRSGAFPTTLNVFNTWTDASNNELAALGWIDVTNTFAIKTKANGTGTGRNIEINSASHLNLVAGTSVSAGQIRLRTNPETTRWVVQSAGHFVSGLDNTYDIGATGATRPRDIFLAGALHTQDAGALTAATGVVTATGSYHTIIGEGAADDDLVTINGCVDGAHLVIQADSDTVTITAKDGTGNLQLAGDFAMDNAQDTLSLICAGVLSAWVETGRSNNGT